MYGEKAARGADPNRSPAERIRFGEEVRINETEI